MTRDGEAIWLRLSVPPGRRKVTRCTADGRASAKGAFVRVTRGKHT